jgi:hypothetical protein
VQQWTTTTPDGRRVIVKRHPAGWTAACGDSSETAVRDRLESALIEAILMDHDFVLHSMQFDYAAWTCELVDQIARRATR